MCNEKFPLLEYDAAQDAVLTPGHEGISTTFPQSCVFAFLGEHIDIYAKEQYCEILDLFVSNTKSFPVYLITHKGHEFCMCQAPVGAPAAVQIMDWLIAHGVKRIISTGTCGALAELPENEFLVPAKALRDEGTSYHYLPAARYIETDADIRRIIEQCFRRKNLPYRECVTWTTDGFFRETRAKVRARRADGCDVVEMECAALAACAQFRGVKFGQFLFTADTLARVDTYDMRDWGAQSNLPALLLALDIAAEMDGESKD